MTGLWILSGASVGSRRYEAVSIRTSHETLMPYRRPLLRTDGTCGRVSSVARCFYLFAWRHGRADVFPEAPYRAFQGAIPCSLWNVSGVIGSNLGGLATRRLLLTKSQFS